MAKSKSKFKLGLKLKAKPKRKEENLQKLIEEYWEALESDRASAKN